MPDRLPLGSSAASQRLLVGDRHDATLQVALERAFAAFLASAGADTLAVLDLAQKATETAQQPQPAARSEDEESDPSTDVAASEPASVDPAEAWFRATEALEDAIRAAEEAAAADDDAKAAAATSHDAVADAKDAARAISRTTEFDGVWEAMIADIDSHLKAALSAVRTAEDSERKALEAQAAAGGRRRRLPKPLQGPVKLQGRSPSRAGRLKETRPTGTRMPELPPRNETLDIRRIRPEPAPGRQPGTSSMPQEQQQAPPGTPSDSSSASTPRVSRPSRNRCSSHAYRAADGTAPVS